MYNVLVLAVRGEPNSRLLQRLEEDGIRFTVATGVEALPQGEAAGNLDAVLVDMSTGNEETMLPLLERCKDLKVPTLCGVPSELLPDYDMSWGAADFFTMPPPPGEVAARIRQARQRDHLEEPSAEQQQENVIQAGDIRIDQERYEVFVRNKRVLLTFKEYKLLCTLAANPGRVFSRETLLTQIWEYDYYGGTRTVDVHIRRLRSKIEDSGDTYIETVWNVGYRLRPQDSPARREQAQVS